MNLQEAELEIEEYWTNIYRKHDNNMIEAWNEEVCDVYKELLEKENLEKDTLQYGDKNLPLILREHYDYDIHTQSKIIPMTYPEIEVKELRTQMKKIKTRKATGPDNITPEMYRAMEQSKVCVTALQTIYQKIVDEGSKVKEWEKSRTKMIPKVKNPTANKLRPIALTDVSYKLFMKIQGVKIDRHITENEEELDNQAGFTRRRQIEDNLFILQYCIESSYTRKKPLIVTCIDYTKAFDSIKREKIIETLIHYRVHPKVIEAIVNIYQEDHTEIEFGQIKKKITITSGIRQGCTGSTVLFKLITYMIINELDRRGRGYSDKDIHLTSLFFADDGLLMAHSIEDAKENLRITTEVSKEFGLEINKEKSNVMIFNMDNHPTHLEGIEVSKKIKYLGITIDNKLNCFKTQKKMILKKARNMANLTYSIIGKSCNKLLIGKTYWKSVAMPSILYGTNVINLTKEEIEQLQVTENSVYRNILDAPCYAPNVTLRGEIGASTMNKRIINSRFNYINGILTGRNEILAVILEKITENKDTKWIETTQKYLNETNMTMAQLRCTTKEEIKLKMKQWDDKLWKKEINERSTLTLYRTHKTEIKEESSLYDNKPASTIFYKARTNTLPLNDRKRHNKEKDDKDTKCVICNEEIEDLYHFMLVCPGYTKQRGDIVELQQPYTQKKEDIVGEFLFDCVNIERKKDQLFCMWRTRDRLLKTLKN